MGALDQVASGERRAESTKEWTNLPPPPRTPHSALPILLWWLVPLAALALVLSASYEAITHRRYPHANGVPGEIVAGGSVGQSFVARYPNLSGVELRLGTYGREADPTRSTLVVRLRSLPDGGALSSMPDLAFVRLPPDATLGENPWYLFSFPPIADSQERAFYVQVESPDGEPGRALTVFWWQPNPEGDPYPRGSAYRDGVPHGGDLAFGLRYSPSPLDAWAQVARAASANLPTGLMLALLLAGAAASVWAVRLPAILRDPARRHRWLAHWSLPLVLVVALANGVVYLLLVPPWQGPDEHSHFAHAALLDRYKLDAGALEASGGESGDRARLAEAITASMARHDFTRTVSWHSAPGAPVRADGIFFQQLRQPPAYYWLSALALRAARAAGLPADPYTDPDTALRVMRGTSLLLNLVVVALAWAAAALLSPMRPSTTTLPTLPTPHSPLPTPYSALWLRLLLPLAVALFPMRAFTSVAANNDALAEVAVSALFVTMLALLRWPAGLRGAAPAALVPLAIALTAAGFAAKSTAPAASVPMLALGLLVWAGMLITRFVKRVLARRGGLARAGAAVPAALALVVLLPGVGLLPLSFGAGEGGEAAGWYTRYWPVEYARRVLSATARDGSHVLQLEPPARSAASQMLVPMVHHPAMTLSVSGWARAVPPEGTGMGVPPSPDIGPATAQMVVREGGREAAKAEIALATPGEWTPLTMTARISESSELVTLRIGASAGGEGRAVVQFDNFSVRVESMERPWTDPSYGVLPVNPSVESAAQRLHPALASFLPLEARQIADVAANPQPFNASALWGYYAEEQSRSFWGNFGWVSLPLPGCLYLFLSALVLLSLAGLGWLGVRRARGKWSYPEWLALISLIAFLFTAAIGFAKQAMYLATQYGAAYPQGRYLFVLIIPFMWLLIAGLWGIWSGVRAGAARLLGPQRPRGAAGDTKELSPEASSHSMLNWGVWLFLVSLFLFTAYCLLSLLAPYYYG